MADETPLETSISAAQAALNKAFGINKNQEGEDANRYLNEETLTAAYKEEASTKQVVQQFLSIAKSIRNMRSSYLPMEFFINEDGRFSQDVASNIGKMESYENTFMRMMGMPSIGSSEFGLTSQDSEIRSGEDLKIVDPITGKVTLAPIEEVKRLVLDERRKKCRQRRVVIDNGIYNISESTIDGLGQTIYIGNLTNEEIALLLFGDKGYDKKTKQLWYPNSGDFIAAPTELQLNSSETGYFVNIKGDVIDVQTSSIKALKIDISNAETQASIDNIESDIWKFSYLLIPPIQDIEISRCINEPDKIVAPPFSNSRTRNVNNSKIKPTLIESVIRIRLDKISGTNSFTDEEADEELNISVDGNPNSYGVLESLFILRLRSAISGLANKLYADIDNIIDEMDKSGRIPISENPDNGKEICEESNEAGDQFEKPEQPADAITETALNSLQEQKLIEDSILFLLGDNSETLDLQVQTQRSSSIHDSHMMSGLISIIDVPRKRIDASSKAIIQSRNDAASAGIEKKTQEIGVVLGTDIGVGTLDVAVFALAMFTISEKSLLGLLSKAQYDKIRNGEFAALLPEDGDKEDTIFALNEFSQLVIDGYNLFISDLELGTRTRSDAGTLLDDFFTI